MCILLITRFSLLLLFTACVVTTGWADGLSQPKNVLFVIADDLNTRLGCYGDVQVQSPHIDRLAKRGTRFDRAYCQFPLCGPSRNSMLTGLYPDATGILNNSQIFRQTIPQRKSLPQVLRLNGYFSGRIGKLYHYNVPNSIGTTGHDDPASWELQTNPAGCDRLLEESDIQSMIPNSFGGTVSWYASPREDALHTDSLLADDAIWVLERLAKQQSQSSTARPFFLAVGFYRPHTPYVSPQKYFELYPKAEMPVVSLELARKQDRNLPAAALGSFHKWQEAMSEQQHRDAIQAYYAGVSFMDAQVGRLLDALDRLDLTHSTLIVFTSDHGYHLGDHGLWQKQSLFEQSARVPMILVAPQMPPSQIVKEPVSLIDLYPTICNWCGVNDPQNFHGQDLTPMLANSDARGRGYALTQVMRIKPTKQGKEPISGYSLRTDHYRYTAWAGGLAGEQLYDYEIDPGEHNNLANQPEYAQLLVEMKSQLEKLVAAARPADGKIPLVGPNDWAPKLD